jgi:chromosome partition protein MukF
MLFEQVCDTLEPGAENPRKRATPAIQRLRDQRLLADDALTRESPTLLTKTLLGQRAEVRSAAQRARSDDDWSQHVTGPLRITVGDLVGGLDRGALHLGRGACAVHPLAA